MTQDSRIHLAIIPDGNRRWARTRMLQPWKGHEVAVENFRTLTNWCRDNGRVRVLTVWCFSTENWKREQKEINKLMELLESYIKKERPNLQKEKTRLVHSGRLDRIPGSLARLITEVCEETKHFDEFTLHLAIDYGGKDEVTRALRKIGDAKNVTEEQIRAHLDHPELPDIDLIIRTSGEYRTSNFFLWQAAYAEWVFLEKHFPVLMPNDLANAVDEFEQRKRRFGGG